MRRFDYSFIKGLKMDTAHIGLTNKIKVSIVKDESRKKENPRIFESLESIARIESVKGSNAIEGIITSDERMEMIVNRSTAPLDHNEMEIAGYRDALDLINNNYDDMDMDEGTVLNLHRIMMSYVPQEGGEYKKRDNVIMNINADGVRSVRFMPVPSEDTARSMKQLMLAYADAESDGSVDPLFLIPCFILDFLCIHPFPDGNGRMSRLLSLLLMYRNGIDVGKYVSFESRINISKGKYYSSLASSSDGWHSNRNDYLPFIENFIETVHSCYKDLDSRFSVVGSNKLNKKNRIEAAVMNSPVPISKQDIRRLLPDVSVTTIEAALSNLQKEGKIKKVGEYRNARYIRNT